MTLPTNKSNIYLGFVSDGGNTEGIGAMMQYQIQCYLLSIMLDVNYYFDGLKNLTHYQYYDITQKEWQTQWEQFFNFPHVIPDVYHTIRIDDYNNLIKFIDNNQTEDNYFIILSGSLLMSYTNSHIDKLILNMPKLKSRIQYRTEYKYKKNCINVALHIRRYTRTDCDPAPCRELYSPDNNKGEYYETLIKQLDQLIPDRAIEYHIYSQGNMAEFQRFSELKLINPYATIVFHLDEFAILSMSLLMTADILIMSNSSFSYLAHFYSDGILLQRASFYQKMKTGAIYTDGNGNFDTIIFTEQLSHYLHKYKPFNPLMLIQTLGLQQIYNYQEHLLNLPSNIKLKIDVGLSYNAPNSELWLQKLSNRYVFGFEPNVECHKYIKNGLGWPGDPQNIKLDPIRIDKNFILLSCALDDTNPCYKKFYSTSRDLGCSSLYVPNSNFSAIKESYDVFCISLESFLDLIDWTKIPYVEHIKIDAQGNDLRILYSAKHYLSEKVVFVTVESANERNAYQCQEPNSGHTIEQLLQYMALNNFEPYDSPIHHTHTGNIMSYKYCSEGNYTFINKKYIELAKCDNLNCSHFGC